MINWMISEGNAFDTISIIEVKLSKANAAIKPAIATQLKFYENLTEEQIGRAKFESVMSSLEYVKLKTVNRQIFDLIDNLKTYQTDAQVINDCNLKRFEYKKAIQTKFFPAKSINEIKFNTGAK